ncbi:MAG: hypothetical protein IPG79_08500 [Saprospiraceae bacterium]|nr:hypothetical protein [Saprospiraceae bacterium]
MSKCTKFWIFILTIVLLLTPIGVYLCKFSSGHLSNDTEAWGQFGDYLNGTFMPMIALIGIIITYYLGMISEARNVANIKLDQQKHRPLLHVGYYDKKHEISIYGQ